MWYTHTHACIRIFIVLRGAQRLGITLLWGALAVVHSYTYIHTHIYVLRGAQRLGITLPWGALNRLYTSPVQQITVPHLHTTNLLHFYATTGRVILWGLSPGRHNSWVLPDLPGRDLLQPARVRYDLVTPRAPKGGFYPTSRDSGFMHR